MKISKEQILYFAIAERINQLRDCNWVDIATGVAEVIEKHFPELKPQHNRDEYARVLLNGTIYSRENKKCMEHHKDCN